MLALQSLLSLPLLVLFTKGTVLALAVAALAGLALRPWRTVLAGLAGLPAVLGLILLCALSALWAVEPGETLGKAAQLAGVLMMALWVGRHAAEYNEAERDTLARLGVVGWCLALGLLCVDALAHPLVLKAIAAVAGADAPLARARTFVFKNGAVILVVTAFPVFATLLTRPWGLLRVAALLVPLALVIVVSRSSSSMAGLCIGLAVWAWHARHPVPAGKVLLAAVVLLPLAMPLLPLVVDPQAVAETVPGFAKSFYHRLVIWDFVADKILQHPLLGWGFESSRAIPGGGEWFRHTLTLPLSSRPLVVNGQLLPLHPHNAGLQIWLELGALGAVMLALVMRRVVRSQVIAAKGPAAHAMAGFVAAVISIGCVAFGMAQAWWLALVFLSWGALKALPGQSGR